MKKILICITGASGSIYAQNLILHLNKKKLNFDIVISKYGLLTMKHELKINNIDEKYFYNKLKINRENKILKIDDMQEAPATGLNIYEPVIIVPCSVNTLSKIACGISDNLITRSAAVALKEKRKLVIVLRETPLSLIVIKNMEVLSSAGAIILPASPGFYHNPQSLNDIVNFITKKILSFI